MPKFFVEKENIKEDIAELFGGDVQHILKVLRMNVGDKLTLCDGEGTDFDATITEASKERVVLKISESRMCPAEPSVSVTLFQGLPKQGKMDYIIEKCTELGISEIVPVSCSRSVVTLRDKQAEEKKLARWRKIASESVKQCGRGVIPKVSDVMTVKEAVSYARSMELPIAAYENEKMLPLKTVLECKKPKSVGIFIGPEGGFSPEEIALFQEAEIPTVTLGTRILRTETAGHTVLTCVMYAFGEMDGEASF